MYHGLRASDVSLILRPFCPKGKRRGQRLIVKEERRVDLKLFSGKG